MERAKSAHISWHQIGHEILHHSWCTSGGRCAERKLMAIPRSQSRKVLVWATGIVVALGVIGGIVSCAPNSSNVSQQQTAKRGYALPSELTVNARAERGPEGEVLIVGSTNFPDGMKMEVEVRRAGRTLASDEPFVGNGSFTTAGLLEQSPNPNFTHRMESWPDAKNLRFLRSPFPAGNYSVRFTAYFNGAWQTPAVLAMLGGEGGRELNGKVLRLTDPDVVDSEKILDTSINLSFSQPSPEAKAISLVKAAVLTVPGSGRSATDIGANVAYFMSTPGLRQAKGWSATTKQSTLYEVAYDFINGGEGEQKAIWSVDLKTGKVKYVNKNAKNFSWTPNY